MFSKFGLPESIEDPNGDWLYPDVALINVPPKTPPARSISDRIVEVEWQHAQANADLQRLLWVVVRTGLWCDWPP
jgi:hypothetical protein